MVVNLRTPFPIDTGSGGKVAGEEKNSYFIARKIFDHVRKSLTYKLEGGWNTAPMVLERGTGSCSEYSFCFIALCRAAGLPARYVGALVVHGDEANPNDSFLRRSKVCLPNYGWGSMDPQVRAKIETFGEWEYFE